MSTQSTRIKEEERKRMDDRRIREERKKLEEEKKAEEDKKKKQEEADQEALAKLTDQKPADATQLTDESDKGVKTTREILRRMLKWKQGRIFKVQTKTTIGLKGGVGFWIKG